MHSLHVFSKEQLLQIFHLEPGDHILGSGRTADLVLAKADAPEEACRIELDPEGKVHLSTLDETPLSPSDGEELPTVRLPNGDFVDIAAGLRLLLVVSTPTSHVSIDLPRSDIPTAPSTGVLPPIPDTLALKIRLYGEVRAPCIDAPQVHIGRGVGNEISIAHPEVSRRHARLFRKADGPWIEDLASAHGTYLNGIRIEGAARWPLGGRVTLSSAPDAPLLELVPIVDTHDERSLSEATESLIGTSSAMQTVRGQVMRYGKQDATVLILGENGTGKDLAARALAKLRGGTYQPVHCGAIPESLIETALFGHKKGAFTGAVQDFAGAFETAKTGTIFLDEIGEMPLTAQAKLLRVLEAREFARVGESFQRPMKARVIAATNRNLPEMVKAGAFREDLFHRLNVMVIRMPPLRAHVDDIPRLAATCLLDLQGNAGGKMVSEEAMKRLLRYSWPGNVRELRNTLHRAANNFDGQEILAEHLEFTEAPAGAEPGPTLDDQGDDQGAAPDRLGVFERELCADALRKAEGNIAEAARLFGKNVNTFRRMLARHGLLPKKG